MKWLQSGLRRDVCVVVAGLDDPTEQQVKAALERRYDERIRPKTFHGALSALVDGGFLARRQEGLADRYALTPAGERALRTHHEWVAETLDAGAAESEGDSGSDSDSAGERDTDSEVDSGSDSDSEVDAGSDSEGDAGSDSQGHGDADAADAAEGESDGAGRAAGATGSDGDPAGRG